MHISQLLEVLIGLDPPDKPGDVGKKKLEDIPPPTPPALCGGSSQIKINNLCIDSRQCRPGDCFLAYPGLQTDGRDYIEQALQAGAAAVIYEKLANSNHWHPADGHLSKSFSLSSPTSPDFPPATSPALCGGSSPIASALPVPTFAVENLAAQVSQLASTFYQQPGEAFHIVGITGTNGKTSISHALAQCYTLLDKQAAVIGTLGAGSLSELKDTGMTTPDPVSVQRQLADMRDLQIDYLAMEVSSHALAQHRVAAVPIKTAVYTNLSQDHLDFHGDMDSYGQCKEQLLQFPDLEHAIINADDEWGARWIECYRDRLAIVAYTMGQSKTDLSSVPTVRCDDFSPLQNDVGYQLQLSTPWGQGSAKLHLLGEYNIANTLAVIATLGAQGFSWDIILSLISRIQSVPGRMQLFRHPSGAIAVVDFAHTPDALQQVLQTLRPLCQGQLRCVFGCGGDRDSGKRQLMGQAAAASADQIWITNDNPRTEDPVHIAQAIVQGCQGHPQVEVVLDRVQAITSALTDVREHDMILVAGKGHEAVQIIGDQKISLSDIDTVRALCA